MTLKHLLCTAALALVLPAMVFAAKKDYQLTSPDGKLAVSVNTEKGLTYSVSLDGKTLIEPSPISMKLSDGTVFGQDVKVKKTAKRSVDENLAAPVYKKSSVRDHFNELTLIFKEYCVIFRAYDEGVAYRFAANRKKDFTVESEQATFRFADDWIGYIPYVRSFDPKNPEKQFFNSFENYYSHIKLSQWEKGHLAFLPITVEAADGVKICITESDLLNYPGMYLNNSTESSTLEGVFAPYPKDVKQGGHNMLQGLVQTREKYIAKAAKDETFPWRVIIVSKSDKELLNNDLVWKLGTPSQGDFSWVKPGKVAWDWWNSWNLYGVDFKAGINNDTYKYYIDFAAQNGIEYVILDEGWAVNKQADLMQIIPEIDLPMLAKYAESKGVGLILWAGYWAFNRDIEGICKHYAKMGIKGFKVDFMDRDDQDIVAFYRKASEAAAKYHLLLDFHGAFKPIGLQRTFPNVLNHEGVNGLEQLKWAPVGTDQVTYDVTIPFVRMVAGPLDYTQGAMRNANKNNYHPVHSEPISQGTRCRQLAEYVIFESPLNMLCDSPSNYLREKECLDFIAHIPTTWDETVALDGKIGAYAAIARRSGNTWYVGALTGWDARDLTLDLGFLGKGNWKMEVFQDGVNAHRAARDYKKCVLDVPADGKVTIHMAPGGGWTAKITK